MTNWKLAGGSAAFITLMGSTAALADITAQEVWTDWHDYMTGFGYEIASSDSASSDGVTVSDLTITMPLPEDSGMVKVALGTISFKDQGDGTVAIVLPDHMPISIALEDDFSVTMNYDWSGLSMVVSGSASEMVYNYSAPQVAFSIDDLMIEGDKIDDAKLDVVMTNLSGTSTSTTGDLRQITQAYGADMLTYDFAVAEPGDGKFSITVNGSIADFKGASDSFVPKDVNFEQMATALNAGFAVQAGLSWGAGGYEFATTDRGASVTGKSASDSGSLNVAVNRQSIQYGGDTKGTIASFTSSDFPFPVEITMADSVFNLLMPVDKTDTPSDFGLTLKLGDFTISDNIWGLVDPAGTLSRNPATILMELDGKANWLIDIMDPESMGSSNADMPGQLHALTLKSLQVKAVGADLTGSGAFTFNNDDLATFDGLPAPTGALDLKLTGGNGLMDNLVAMGLLPEDQAMGARMMMGLFAVAGDGEDTLTSKIEVTADGQVLANGQRLK